MSTFSVNTCIVETIFLSFQKMGFRATIPFVFVTVGPELATTVLATYGLL